MNYIAHYGIKGQKHGTRRFQNEDGSLTPAGKLRYQMGYKSAEAQAMIENGENVKDVMGAGADLQKETAKASARELKRVSVEEVKSRQEKAERERLDKQKNRTLKSKLSAAVNGPEARAGRRHVSDTLSRLSDAGKITSAQVKLGAAQLKLAYKMDKSMKKRGYSGLE